MSFLLKKKALEERKNDRKKERTSKLLKVTQQQTSVVGILLLLGSFLKSLMSGTLQHRVSRKDLQEDIKYLAGTGLNSSNIQCQNGLNKFEGAPIW